MRAESTSSRAVFLARLRSTNIVVAMLALPRRRGVMRFAADISLWWVPPPTDGAAAFYLSRAGTEAATRLLPEVLTLNGQAELFADLTGPRFALPRFRFLFI